MAMKIDPEACIDCAACAEPCPNTAIYPGGESYSVLGQSRPSLSDKYFVAPERCTECATYYDQPQCVEACPVDCISKDPAHSEAPETLKKKADRLRQYR